MRVMIERLPDERIQLLTEEGRALAVVLLTERDAILTPLGVTTLPGADQAARKKEAIALAFRLHQAGRYNQLQEASP